MARKFKSRDTEINYYIKYLGAFGIKKEFFQNESQDLYNTAWLHANKAAEMLVKKNDFQALSILYRAMAIISDETERQAPHEFLKKSARFSLLSYQARFPNGHVIIMASFEGCEACKSQNGKRLSIKDALETMPLPHKDCSTQWINYSGYCRCSYNFSP